MTDERTGGDEQVLVGGLCGSLRSGSYTKRAVEVALAGARDVGAEVELIDLATYDLVFCSGDHTGETSDVQRLRRTIAACDGLVIGTPEYHGSFSGVLKNALDLMGFDEMRGKMVGLVGVAGGAMGGLNALNSLRTVGRSLHAWVVPEQATIPKAWEVFADDGSITDPKLEERLRKVGREVARFSFLHGSNRAREFLRLWEGAPPNPGG